MPTRRVCLNCLTMPWWGQAITTHLNLPEAIIELGLTPNRGDCFSLRGIAFDVAAAFGARAKPFNVEPAVSHSDVATPKVRLEAGRDCPRYCGRDCPRYCGRAIEGLDANAPTPSWMRQRLQRSGLRPISLLVDVTNYVMLELGQPMHAFDRDSVRGDIVVRRSAGNECLSLLDAREVTVGAEYLLIADDVGPLALAGVMGGLHSRITDATAAVFLERPLRYFWKVRTLRPTRLSDGPAIWACIPMRRTASSVASIRNCRAQRSSMRPG